VVALLFLLSGCASPASPPECTTDCTPSTPVESPTLPPDRPVPPPGPNSTIRSARLEACTGLVARLDVPYERARALVPASFAVSQASPGLATAHLFALACPRSSNTSTAFGPVHALWATVVATPTNASWLPSGGVSRYVIEVDYAGEAFGLELSVWNLTATAVTVTVAETNGVVRWNAQGGGRAYEFEYAAAAPPVQPTSGTVYFWYADGAAFRRLDAAVNFRVHDFGNAGTLRGTGSSPLLTLLPATPYPWTGQAYHTFDGAWVLNPILFGGQP
jgi:hypothetical protein